MKATIFHGSRLVLVNGSEIWDFSLGKGLRHEDPLSPFLFILVMEGLNHIMKKAVVVREFIGFVVE